MIAALIMILKGVGMSWLRGLRSPQDIRRTRLNPDPDPVQLQPSERVERIRRIHMNDLESLPYFLVAGLLFVCPEPQPWLAQWLFCGYVATRARPCSGSAHVRCSAAGLDERPSAGIRQRRRK